MNRSPMKLHEAARTCREMASECVTEDARDALLEVAESLDGEADEKERAIESRMVPKPMFDWPAAG